MIEETNNNSETSAEENLEAELKENDSHEGNLLEHNLENKIADLENNNKDLNDKLLRLAAELDNVRRRSRDEIEKSNKYAISNFVTDLVVAVEHFYLAVENMPKEEIEKNKEIKHFVDAILMTQKELVKILEKNNVKRVYPLGETFNHNYHEAISQIPADEGEEGEIVKQVVQAGYLINDRIIKPALVVVSVK